MLTVIVLVYDQVIPVASLPVICSDVGVLPI